MSAELWIAFVGFAFVAAVTPGPNNMLLMASGLNVGILRTLPFVAGINVGFAVLIAAVGLGLGTLFSAVPEVQTVMRLVGAAWLCWLAYKIATAPVVRTDGGAAPVLGFLDGATFQAVNPKAWVTAVSAVAVYAPAGSGPWIVPVIVGTFWLVGIPSNLAWVAGGRLLRGLLESPRRMRVFNVAMALLLVASIVPVIWT